MTKIDEECLQLYGLVKKATEPNNMDRVIWTK